MCEQTIRRNHLQRRFQAQCQFIESEKRRCYNKKHCDYPTRNFHALSVAALSERRKRCEWVSRDSVRKQIARGDSWKMEKLLQRNAHWPEMAKAFSTVQRAL